jgi:hypothetical protein
MNSDARQISVIEPIGPAIERVKLMLFRPFDMGRWFAIGFCAWLSFLGEGGFNFRVPYDNCGPKCGRVHSVREACPADVALVAIIVAAVFVFAVVISLVLLWLRSRGKFMFLDCVARNSQQIKAPWRNYGTPANSLFLFQVAATILFLVVLAPLIAVLIWCGVLLARDSMYTNAFIITAMVSLGLLIVTVIVVFSIIMKFTFDFVVPVMYIYKRRCLEAWGRFRSILSGNKGKFALYILFQILIGLAIGTIIVTAVLLTCCCAACIFAVPYIGTVALLPLLIFRRAYSAYYLRQYGDEFDVFTAQQADDSSMISNPV